MTDIATPQYTPGKVTMTITVDLAHMPEVSTRYGRNGIIASRAEVYFDIIAGTPSFQRIELKGSVPLKTGGPSQRSQSDSYSNWQHDLNAMPGPIQSVVAYAEARLREMLA